MIAVPLAVTIAGFMLPGTAAWANPCAELVVITVQPTTTQVTTAMTPAVQVQVEQSDGEVDQGYTGWVTLSYAANQVGAPTPSDNTVKAVKGVATFSGLSFSAVGFGFELTASISGGAQSAASASFDIVSQLVHCSPGKSCLSGTVSSAGTSASANVAAGGSADVLTATGGGFPLLSCSSRGGVVSVSVPDRSKVITVTLSKSLVPHASSRRDRDRDKDGSKLGICLGSPTPFTTATGAASGFNPANDEYEGLLPACSSYGPSPCVKHQSKDCAGDVVSTISAPPGDPHITY
jgi:hypothetical protein